MNRRSAKLRLALAVVVSSLIVTGGTSFSAKAGAQTSPVSLAPVITTIAGNGTADSGGDGGPATDAGLNGPSATAVDAAGNVYIAEAYGSRVRKIDTTGTISTIVGNGNCGSGGDGGPAVNATVCQLYGIAVDATGNVYIADTYNHRVRKPAAISRRLRETELLVSAETRARLRLRDSTLPQEWPSMSRVMFISQIVAIIAFER
jgi:hypothetical protein